MPARSEHYFEFGPFRLNAVERLLLHRGEVVPLTPKAFEVLLILVRNSGHVVERAELIDAVWPDIFVEEANLTQNIFNLRRALGESYRGQKYIQTVARRGYRFVADVKEGGAGAVPAAHAESGAEARAVGAPPGGRSDHAIALAVLPFVNLSDEPGLEYLSDGITESLINNLSYLSQLRVSASSSVFRLKGRNADPLQIGHEMSVDAVVLGKVLSFGERLIIRTELVETANGWQLWGAQYDRESGDLFEVQEEIAREVAAKLQLRLTGAELGLLAKRHTRNDAAYQGRTYGVAKNVQLHSVKVCNDSGVCPDSNVIAGLNWVISNHTKPAVINMSLGGFASQSASYPQVDQAVNNAIAAGITCVVAAGNNNVNVSAVYPAHVAGAITVGATTRTDAKASYSNFGFGVDVFAPGGQAPDHYIPVPASGYFYGGANNVSDGFTGTSASAPHAAGVAALYLEQYSLYSPTDPATSPANVSGAITGNATPDRISGLETCRYDRFLDDIVCTPNSPNLLLYSLFMSPPATNPVDDTRFFVRQQYFDFLRRTPDALWEQWISYIDGCGGDAQCVNGRRLTTVRGVIESQEFRQAHPALLNNSPGTSAYNDEYVRQLYLCLLQREPDGAISQWLSYINSTGDYDGLVGGFVNSTEYRELRFK